MKKIILLLFFFISLHVSFAQHTIDSLRSNTLLDSSFDKYAHYGMEIGSAIAYCNLDALRSQGYMLGQPADLNFLPLGEKIHIGRVNKFFCTLEYAFGTKNSTGEYTEGLNTFKNMEVGILNSRYGITLNRNLNFSKHFAFDVSLGPSFSNLNISSRNIYNTSTTEVFASGKLRQATVYAGTMFRLFWPTRSCDAGFSLKLGYNIPVAKANWYSANFNQQKPPQVDMSGFSASLSFYMWGYTREYTMKHLKYNPYMYYPPPYAKDTAPAPTDSTKSLFKNTSYSYIQWDLGYTALNLKNEWKNGFDISFIGVVFNKKYFTSLGVLGFAQTVTITGTPPPKVDSYIGIYWNNEFLVKPDNLINFSFPLKISFAGATGWDTIKGSTQLQSIHNWNFTGVNYYQHYGQFLTIAPGANVFVNIFKPLSLGVGVNYRFALNVPKELGTNADFSNLGMLAFLRLKFDTRAMYKRAAAQQKAAWDTQKGK